MSIKATLYIRPNGATKEINITRINPEDAQWLNDNSVKVSLEDAPPLLIIYADYGKTTPDGEPDEHLLLVPAYSDCVAAMARLVTELKALKKDPEE